MFRVQSLSNKIKVLSLLFLLAGLSSVSVTLWVTWQLEGGAAAVNEAGRLRMQVFRMQLSHQNHERNLLAQGNARFGASLQLLRDGDPARPLLILWTPQMRAQFERIEQDWQRLSALEERATSPEFRAQGDALVQVIDHLVTLLEREMVRWKNLAQGFVQQVRATVQADAVSVRWSDEANERYVLLASDGLPQALSIHEHCLPTGACLCAPPQEGAKVRVIRLNAEETMALPHCREAGYATLVGVPLRHQQRLLGEVNLYFLEERVLTPETHALLTAMAEHLASAMEGLRVTALEREAAVAQERSLIARELHDSIAQSLAFLKIQTQLLPKPPPCPRARRKCCAKSPRAPATRKSPGAWTSPKPR